MKSFAKKARAHLRNNAFLYKVMLLFLSVTISFLLLIVFFFRQVNAVAVDEFDRNESSLFLHRVSALSGQLTQLYQNSTSFLSNDAVVENLKPYEQLTSLDKSRLTKVVKGLLNLQVMHSDIVRQFFLLTDDRYVYTAQGLYDFDNYFVNQAYLSAYPAEYWRSALASEKIPLVLPASQLVSLGRESPVLPMVFKVFHGQRQHTLVALLSIDNILFSLNPANSLDITGVSYLQEGQPFYTRGAAPPPTDRLQMNQTYKLLRAEDVQGNKFQFVINRDLLSDQISNQHQVLVYAFELFFGILFVTVILVVIKLSSPLKRLLGIVREQATISQAWQGEGANYEELLASSTKYLHHLSGIESEHLSLLFRNTLFSPFSTDQADFGAYLKDEYGFSSNQLTCVYIQTDYGSSFSNEAGEEALRLLDLRLNQVYLDVLKKHFPCAFVQIAQGKSCILLNTGDSCSQLSDMLKEIEELFRYEFMDYAIQIGIGTSEINPAGLRRSYISAESAVWWADDQTRFHISCADEYAFHSQPVLGESDMLKLRNFIRSAKYTNAKKLILDIDDKSRETFLLLDTWWQQIYDMFRLGARIISNSNINADELSIDNENWNHQRILAADGFNHDKTLDDLLNYLQAICQSFDTSQQTYSNAITKRTKAYILENYKENISLDSISEALSVSPKYLSRVFKEATSERISDYITNCRMEHAKMLMRTTDMNITDIGAEVGIPSRTTFFRLFKTIEGISPGEYRNKVVP